MPDIAHARRAPRMIGGALLLALAACSNASAPAVNEAAAEQAVANATASPGAMPARGLPVSDKTAILPPSAIPPAFEGRWGLMPADCDIARSDVTGLMTVRGSALTFYGSSATAKVIGGPSRYKVVADLSFSDAGRTWRRRETLELVSAGTALLRTEQSPTKTYRYERC